jgi:hypothetical protein
MAVSWFKVQKFRVQRFKAETVQDSGLEVFNPERGTVNQEPVVEMFKS